MPRKGLARTIMVLTALGGVLLIVYSYSQFRNYQAGPKDASKETEQSTNHENEEDGETEAQDQDEEEGTSPAPDTESSQDEPSHTLSVSAWIAWWDFVRSVEIYDNNHSLFESVSPTWYYVLADGSLAAKKSAGDTNLRNLCNSYNTKLIPTISNPSADELSAILNDDAKLDAHVAAIKSEVISQTYDGIDIDYEQLKSEDRERYTLFIGKLNGALKENEKLLTIAVLPKTDDAIYSLSPSRNAQDWAGIAPHVDQFRIMGYDFVHNSTTNHGSISPVDWLDEVLDYAVNSQQIPKEKIILGLPLYGYNWDSTGNTATTAVTWEEVQSIIENQHGEKDLLDQETREKHLEYSSRHVWYQDAESISYRLEVAREYKIHGVIFWRLGGEDPEVWNLDY